MAILDIKKYGSSILRNKVELVEDFSQAKQLIPHMFDTMYEARGIGLAANQIGENLNIITLDIGNYEEESAEPTPRYFINCKILETTGSVFIEEGCLSVPEIRAEIERPEKILLEFLDLEQNRFKEEFDGITARVLLHEIDHLHGKMFIDYLPPSKKMLLKKKLQEIVKTGKPSSGIVL
jgi:peptide deformylase